MESKPMMLSIPVDRQMISDLIITGVEQGISYWSPDYKTYDSRRIRAGGFPNIPSILGGCFIEILEADADANVHKWHVIDLCNKGWQNRIKSAFLLMAEKWPHHFADFYNDNSDSITGDVFIQLMLFGDIKYG